jgi:flagellar basal body-associated protein FliL
MDEKKKDAPAANAAKGKEEPPKQEKKPSGNNNNLILLVGIIVIGVLLQIIIPKIVAPPSRMTEDSEETTEGVDAAHGTVDLNATEMGATTEETPVEVLVNIAGTDGERFLKAALVMEYIDKTGSKKEPEKKEKKEGENKEGENKEAGPAGMAAAIKLRMPKYKNYLLENLSKMTMAELTAPETKEKIRKDFIQMVNNSLPPNFGVVKDIYFTQYIIQ